MTALYQRRVLSKFATAMSKGQTVVSIPTWHIEGAWPSPKGRIGSLELMRKEPGMAGWSFKQLSRQVIVFERLEK